jgi:hypothetical protein
MSRLKLGMTLCLPLVLLMSASAVRAATLQVNCGGKGGLTSIGAALKQLQYSGGHGSSTVNVSGACHENVVIRGIDHLTLNAVNGASVSDASGGTLDTIQVTDSRDVTITGLSIFGGADGIACADGALCRLTNDTVQNAGNGVAVFTIGQARLTGMKLNNNAVGLFVNHGGDIVGDASMQGNDQGMRILAGAVLYINATITQSHGVGIFSFTNATLDCFSCVITDNAGGGVLLRQGSSARFTDFTISNNGGPGIAVSEVASVQLQAGTSTGNAGGTDVLCGSQFPSVRGATTDINGGTTNCVEP